MGEQDIGFLHNYCMEHIGGDLHYELITPANVLPVYYARCLKRE